MKFTKPIEEILFKKGKIDKEQLSQIKLLKEESGEDAEKIIIEKKLATEEDITEIKAEEIGVPFLDLKKFIVDPAVADVLDRKTAQKLNALPLYRIKDTLTVAMVEPQNIIALDDIKIKTGFKNIQVLIGTKSAILEGIEQNYTLGNTLEEIIKPIRAKGIIYDSLSDVTPHMLATIAGDPPIIKFVNQMIFDAFKSRASDIHVEPLQDKIRIRFRVDGILHNIVTIPKGLKLAIIPRLKILANLDITEGRRPQDGRFTISVAGRQLDLRISIFPITYGESASIRLLDRTATLIGIEKLGLPSDVCKKFRRLIKSAHGIILVTGPTGCGKTTTLYAALSEISSPEKNVFTIEDPIEYTLENVNQAQVNPKVGLKFATALRSFLRQDPDILMVGEIRDSESALMAFRAAVTGHLILSTLHTIDAPTAITRLKDLGLDKNMLSSSMVCVLAQRLIRTICPSCKAVCHPDKKLFDDLKIDYDPKVKYYRGKGCDDCRGTGYKGRTGIFELLEFTDEIRILVQKDVPIEEIREAATNSGMEMLKVSGMDKAKEGVTTIEEVLRVTQD